MLEALVSVLLTMQQNPGASAMLLIFFSALLVGVWRVARTVATRGDLERQAEMITKSIDDSVTRLLNSILDNQNQIRREVSHANENATKAHERLDGVEGVLYQLKGEHEALTRDCNLHKR